MSDGQILIADCYTRTGAPIRCYKCGHDKFRKVTTDQIENIVCEYDEFCQKCGVRVASWAYGHYEQ